MKNKKNFDVTLNSHMQFDVPSMFIVCLSNGNGILVENFKDKNIRFILIRVLVSEKKDTDLFTINYMKKAKILYL